MSLTLLRGGCASTTGRSSLVGHRVDHLRTYQACARSRDVAAVPSCFELDPTMARLSNATRGFSCRPHVVVFREGPVSQDLYMLLVSPSAMRSDYPARPEIHIRPT